MSQLSRLIFRLAFGLIILFFLPSSIALANGVTTISGGGNVVYENGQLYILDLVEAKTELTPLFLNEPEDQIDDEALRSQLTSSLPGLTDNDVTLLMSKFADIAMNDPVLAMSIEKTMRGLQWSLTETYLPLIDPGSSYHGDILQIAIRTADQVSINQSLWDLLDSKQKVVLIFHEAIAALENPNVQIGRPARVLVGELFNINCKFNLLDKKEQQASLRDFPSFTKLPQLPIFAGHKIDLAHFPLSSFDEPDLRQVGADPSTQTPPPSPSEVTASELQFLPELHVTKINSDGNSETTVIPVPAFTDSSPYAAATVELTEICASLAPHAAQTIEAGYYGVSTQLDTTPVKGSPEPRYSWTMVYHPRTQIVLSNGPCTDDNKDQLNALLRWLARFENIPWMPGSLDR